MSITSAPAVETPFGKTIAHGFLTLSLLSALMRDAITVDGVRMTLNYGLNRVRFVSPVPSGSRIRARVALGAVEDMGDSTRPRGTSPSSARAATNLPSLRSGSFATIQGICAPQCDCPDSRPRRSRSKPGPAESDSDGDTRTRGDLHARRGQGCLSFLPPPPFPLFPPSSLPPPLPSPLLPPPSPPPSLLFFPLSSLPPLSPLPLTPLPLPSLPPSPLLSSPGSSAGSGSFMAAKRWTRKGSSAGSSGRDP